MSHEVSSWSASRPSSEPPPEDEYARVSSSSLVTPSRLWSFGSAGTSLSLAATDNKASTGQRTGMNRWKGDGRNQVEALDSVGAKAGSADSLFESALLSKKTKIDFKLRTNQVPKTQFRAEKLPTSTLKQSMSMNHEGGTSLDVQQDRDRVEKTISVCDALSRGKQVVGVPHKDEHEESMFPEQAFDLHHIRDTILKQEAVFREQVRELHRVHKVQALLLAEMRKKDFDMLCHPTGTNLGGPCQSRPEFAINSGRWNCVPGQVLKSTGQTHEASISLPGPLKGGSAIASSDSDLSIAHQETKLLTKTARVLPVRRTFDLERPPEDNEDDDGQPEDSYKPAQGIQFLELHASRNEESESDISLNLNSGWGKDKSVKERRESTDKSEYDLSRSLKRPREAEEEATFPFLAIKPDSFRDAPFRPTPTVATQSFLGGLWGLQLGRKLDDVPKTDGTKSSGDSGVPIKMERHPLDLEVDEKALPAATPKSAPHWLLQATTVQPSKKSVCRTENSNPQLQDSFSPPRNSTEQGMTKSSSSYCGAVSGSGLAAGLAAAGEQQVSGTSQWNRSQSSHNSLKAVEEDGQPGLQRVYESPVLAVSSTTGVGGGYGPFKLGQGVGEAPQGAVAVYSSWREVGDSPCNSFARGVFSQSHPLAGGFGVQLRSVEGPHPGLAAQGLVQVGPAVNLGAGNATFVPDSGPGVWYQQRNPDFHPQYHQHQQYASVQVGPLSSPRQGPWQAPFQLSQGAAYGPGTVYAIPAPTGQSIGFPLDNLRKTSEDQSGANWTSTSVGPPFSPFSIVGPPKPPFRKPPKLVLTHGSDGTSMELKLVSPEREVAGKLVAKSFSGSSDEDVENRRDGGPGDGVLHQGRVQKEWDSSLRSRGKRERDKRTSSFPLKDSESPASGGSTDWMVAKVSSAVHSRIHEGRNGVLPTAGSGVAMVIQEGMDDADGGSSDAGSGGSGVGDVINPGDRASPSLQTFAAGGSTRNLPAGEGEEGVNMGEIGLQADSESVSEKFDRKLLDDQCCKHQEVLQGQLSSPVAFESSLAMIGRKASQENLEGSGHGFEHMQKHVRGIHGLAHEREEKAPVFHGVLEQSSSSAGVNKNLLDMGKQSHTLCPARKSLDECQNAQLELQQPTNSTSQPRRLLQDSGSQGKESSVFVESSECSVSDHGSKIAREQLGGRLAMDIDGTGTGKAKEDLRVTTFSNFGDVCKEERESKLGRSKQLSGASTSAKDVLHNPYSPGLHQVPSPSSREDMERYAEGSSKKVSQASETVQGNGRSPLRTGERIVPTAMEQDHFCSPGGIDSSCEEVDGTLVKRLQGGEMEQKDSIHFCAVEGRQIFTPSERRKMASIFVLG